MPDIQHADKRIYPKIEDTYSTDSVPTAAEMVRTRGVTFANYEGDKQSQSFDGDKGRFQTSVNASPHSSVTFDMDFAGSGLVDTAPQYKDILLACGMNVTENVGSDVSMVPSEDVITDSISMYFARNEGTGMGLAKSLGMRGELGLTIKRGEVPLWQIKKMLGTYIQPAYNPVPLAVGAPANQLKGIPVNNLNTPTVLLDSTSICLESFTLDSIGHQVDFWDMPGCRAVKSQPKPITASMVIKDEGYSTKNWLAIAESHAGVTQIPFSLVHGVTFGNTFSLACSDMQVTDIKETELSGLKAWDLSLSLLSMPTFIQM